MAPQERQLPGTQPTATEEATVDERSLAHPTRTDPAEEHREPGGAEPKSCLYCLSGWVFLGSIGYEGEEVIEAIRCRRCKASESL